MFDRDYRGAVKGRLSVEGGCGKVDPGNLYRSYIMAASISESV